ncbi:hypothetical protein ASD15_19890 [Massilia sp. Root351]|jgi:hypothetical protein|uniref:hypothetical protein n=1 Tax=Massilia sp. Root351 TaxID=1736522 RepID=UPI000710C11E|nr:hypothetical protein [Massilia sp. Root351]KQV78940.1 hypothetical protein ASD15_19890 [Massilia sp. Root351]
MKVDINANAVQGKLEFVKKMGSADFRAALDGAMEGGPALAKDAAAELEAYMKQTPAERMREALLKKLGISEEELAAMPPEQRKAVEDKLGELVVEEMQKTEQKKGTRIDTSA